MEPCDADVTLPFLSNRMSTLPGRLARGFAAALGLSLLPFSAAFAAQATGFMATVDGAMGAVNGVISSVFFYDIAFWDESITVPLVVAWLVVASIFLTFRMGFINFRAFKHALQVTSGKYTDPKAPGDVSHFQALTTALSATVGLGNIAGVAIAVSMGGPGATFWMICAGLIGMTAKFTECTLGQQYRADRTRRHRARRTDALPVQGPGGAGDAEVRQGSGRVLRDPLHRRFARRRQQLPGQPVA